MAVIQPSIAHLNKDTCATVAWNGLTLRSGTVSCPGGNTTLNWLSGAHGFTPANIGTICYISPTGGTAGLYALMAVGSATTATFALTMTGATNLAGNCAPVTSVAASMGDVGAPYSQPDAALDRSLQVHGTFGAAGSLSLWGSNDCANFSIAKDNTGAVLSPANVIVRNVFDGPLFYVPMVMAGDATTNLTAIMCVRIQLPRPFQ